MPPSLPWEQSNYKFKMVKKEQFPVLVSLFPEQKRYCTTRRVETSIAWTSESAALARTTSRFCVVFKDKTVASTPRGGLVFLLPLLPSREGMLSTHRLGYKMVAAFRPVSRLYPFTIFQIFGESILFLMYPAYSGMWGSITKESKVTHWKIISEARLHCSKKDICP